MAKGSTINYFSYPTNIAFGNGAVGELGAYLKANKLRAPLIVTDPVVANLDFFKYIIRRLKAKGIKTEVYCDIHKNPVKTDVLKGGKTFKGLKRDSVIGIGGGASMDVARAIVLRINHSRDLFAYDDLQGGSIYVTKEVPHFITIPTTSGTGSEVGRSAIISENQSKKKRILFHPKLLAKMVFADPELTYDLPPAVTAATGMDALTHNMEAFLAKGYHPMCDGIALEGIRLIANALEKAVKNNTKGSRSDMMMGSLMGAVAFQKGLGVVHSMAHPLSSLLDMHHGLANAICIPHGMEFNIPGQEEKFKQMGLAMGLGKPDGKTVVEKLHILNQKIGIPAHLSDLGVNSDHINTLRDLAILDFCHPSNPIPVKAKDFKNLYKSAL
jgi:alcohol dehydrogenase class IV